MGHRRALGTTASCPPDPSSFGIAQDDQAFRDAVLPLVPRGTLSGGWAAGLVGRPLPAGGRAGRDWRGGRASRRVGTPLRVGGGGRIAVRRGGLAVAGVLPYAAAGWRWRADGNRPLRVGGGGRGRAQHAAPLRGSSAVATTPSMARRPPGCGPWRSSSPTGRSRSPRHSRFLRIIGGCAARSHALSTDGGQASEGRARDPGRRTRGGSAF